ncbi:hypothetical protein ACHHYP_07576 [Achlya hypogyna]|uniref:Uncharacterized protein n=1 Tax=Achlya hypogyna TaxID=1202772 RepID=A0A1V9YQR7_ACHHY|nr:hypothetical protein ACHHYP_07576 [Achlya hypogyna]
MRLTEAEREREQRMLMELREMRRQPAAFSTLSKKRLRVPQADADNPFCADRQVADASSLARLNKNPQLNAPTGRGSTVRVNPRNHSENRVTSPAAALFPAYAPSLPTRQSAGDVLRQHAAAKALIVDSKRPIVTFGHRPKSASRSFDPASLRLNAAAEGSATQKPAPANVGMSAASLRALLHPPQPKAQAPPVPPPESLEQAPDLALLERGFNNRQHIPTKLRAESILNVPTDASVAELLQKYRKLAVGVDLP